MECSDGLIQVAGLTSCRQDLSLGTFLARRGAPRDSEDNSDLWISGCVMCTLLNSEACSCRLNCAPIFFCRGCVVVKLISAV